jgi:hypothetical protein
MSTLRVNTLQNTSGVEVYTCKAWVNFNGTGSSSVIRASGNVSSVTDNGTADYTVNFATAISDANYAVNCSISSDNNGTVADTGGINIAINTNLVATALVAPTTTAFRMTFSWPTSGRPNPTYVNVSVFR